MKLISFTLMDGEKVYINPKHVVSVTKSGEISGGNTDISLLNDCFYSVKESMERVVNRLRGD